MKVGLVLEGGASRAYFTVGVLDALLEKNIYLNYIIGASAGIANGISYASGQIGRNMQIAADYLRDKRYMGFKHLLNRKNRSYYNIPFVFEQIPNTLIPIDYEALAKYKGEIYAAVTNVETGKPDYLKIDDADKKWTKLVATCSLPILFQPAKINGKRYMDGGISDPIPADKALADGCDKVLVVATRERTYFKEKEAALKLAAFVYRKHKQFHDILLKRTEIYNLCHAHLLDLERRGKALIICPQNTGSWKRTESGDKKIQEMYAMGKETVQNELEKIRKFLNM